MNQRELRDLTQWLGNYNLQQYARDLLELGADMEQLPHLGSFELTEIETNVFANNPSDFSKFQVALEQSKNKNNNSNNMNNMASNINFNNSINLEMIEQKSGQNLSTVSNISIYAFSNDFQENETFLNIFFNCFINGLLYSNNINDPQQLKPIETFLNNIGLLDLINLLSQPDTPQRKLSIVFVLCFLFFVFCFIIVIFVGSS